MMSASAVGVRILVVLALYALIPLAAIVLGLLIFSWAGGTCGGNMA